MFKAIATAAILATAAYAGYNADIVIDKAAPFAAKVYHDLTYTTPKDALTKCYKRAIAKMDFTKTCGAEMDRVIAEHGLEDAIMFGNGLAVQGMVDIMRRAR